MALNDIAQFWEQHYTESFRGSFTALTDVVSDNSDSPSSPTICDDQTYGTGTSTKPSRDC